MTSVTGQIREQHRTAIPMTGVPAPPGGMVVPFVWQEQTEWCWAACAAMVVEYNTQSAASQCEFAKWLFVEPSCCEAPQSTICNSPCLLDDVSDVYQQWGIASRRVGGQLPFQTVATEIAAQRPIEVALHWGYTAHLVLIVDSLVIIGVPWVTVHDPFYGRLVLHHAELLTAYGRGNWHASWVGIQG
jgi:hypothetical protein